MKTKGRPMPIIGSAMSATSNFPTTATIHAVMVVPRLAPMITPIDWMRVSSPALTKDTTSTVVADEDWTSEVVRKPVKIPLKRFAGEAGERLAHAFPREALDGLGHDFHPEQENAERTQHLQQSYDHGKGGDGGKKCHEFQPKFATSPRGPAKYAGHCQESAASPKFHHPAVASGPEVGYETGVPRSVTPIPSLMSAKATGKVSAAVMASRVLGLLREMMFAGLFGGSKWMDCFYLAFKVPNLLRDLFAEGALSQAFVTTFSKKLKIGGRRLRPGRWPTR